MPLIIISGFPCCGKSTYCKQLEAYLKGKGIEKVIIINEETENVNKRLGYREEFDEKKTRGALKSAVDHVLNTDSYVILDSMNYIKGYRYELFCISRSLRTPHCCIWVESDEELAAEWNQTRKAESIDKGYDNESLLELRRRFEAPIEKNRWDFPLFRVFTVPTIISDITAHERAISTEDVTEVSVGKGTTLNLGTEKQRKFVSESAVAVQSEVQRIPVPLTSTKGQMDINCLAVDKVAKFEYRTESALQKPVKPTTSSWRPKVQSDTNMTTSRTFVTLWGEALASSRPVLPNGEMKAPPSSALSISGYIPVVTPDDQSKSLEAVMHQIYLHLSNTSQIAAPNSSTISVPRVNADLLHELDRTSQNITQRIVTHQSENVEGTPLIFHDFDRTLALHRHVGLAELQRHRRQFVKTNSNLSHSSLMMLGSSFIDSLASNL